MQKEEKNNKSKKLKIKVADIVGKSEPLILKREKKEGFEESLPARPLEEKLEEKVDQFENLEVERFSEEEALKKPAASRLKKYFVTFILLLFLGGGVYGVVEFLPRAAIQVMMRRADWQYVEAVTAKRNLAEIDVLGRSIPAEIFSQRKNFSFTYPATGKKQVERKAIGKITIFNGYSSASQALVAGTRFSSPDGKIFRLEKNVTVPGAKIVEGKVIPSSIEAAIVADVAGPASNIGPVSRFYIPAFKGSPKYESFYGALSEPTKGGFIGELAYPTDLDIKRGKEESAKALRQSTESLLSLNIPSAFKLIDGSKQFSILKETVNQEVDENGNFSIFLEAESSIIAFEESDVLALMKELARSDLKSKNYSGAENLDIKSYKFDYGSGRLDLPQGQLSFALNMAAVLWEPLDPYGLSQKVMGKNEKDLKALIYSLPGVQKATISFWPFWVKSVPANSSRIKIEVD